MSRKLDILVPVYNEDLSVIKSLLDSIALQQNVDLEEEVGVIVCCDGGSCVLDDEFCKKYPFTIEFHMCEHGGVSATRNACLEKSKADYVMFCDCDDMFYNMCGLWIVFREIYGSGFDGLISVFIEETRDEFNMPMYINHNMDSTFVHGKVYKRMYLIRNGIKFNPALTIHEDSYFNALAQNMSEDMKICQTPFYLWRWRDDSVCRHDKKYILKTYSNMLDSNTALVEEFIRRNKNDRAAFFATSMIYDSYFTMNKDEWINQENKDYRHKTEVRFKKYWNDFKDLFYSVSKNERTQIVSSIRQRFYAEGLIMESITFDDWIKTVENIED